MSRRPPNAVLRTYDYTAFGQPVSDGAIETPHSQFLYTGQQYDWDTGLQYSRARYYDAALMRFLSEDPLGFAAGDTNLYRYVGNSPANFTDPSGNFAIAIPFLYAGLKVAGAYLATQFVVSAAETAIEGRATKWIGGSEAYNRFSYVGTFAKNFGINVATGGIGSKGKWGYQAAAWVGRQVIEVGGDTAYDVWNGKDLQTSLLVNSVGSVAGDAVGRSVIYAGAKALNSRAGQAVTAYAGAFLQGAGSVRPGAAYSRLDFGLGEYLAGGIRGVRDKMAPRSVGKHSTVLTTSTITSTI